MPPFTKVLLIFGAGPRVGAGVADAFAARGYKVALASRKPYASFDGINQIHIPCDLSDPSSVPNVFSKTKEILGAPSVVVYNGMSTDIHPYLNDKASAHALQLMAATQQIARIL